MNDHADPQLQAAVDHLLTELDHTPYQPPPRPDYPDRRGMGIPPGGSVMGCEP